MIDTHCHLIDPQFTRDLDQVCKRAQDAGISYIINAGYDVTTSQSACVMFESKPWLLPSVGIHPNEAARESLFHMGTIDTLAKTTGVVAIGETGLDYFRDRSPRAAQEELFKKHINIAHTQALPLLIHTRNSIEEAISIIESAPEVTGVFHCFSGTSEQAQRIVDLGFYLGFGGVLTFSKKAKQVFASVPIERILLETDAPFLAPEGHRGKRNEPAYIREILCCAATIIEQSASYVERVTDENAHALFKIE
jgi:TatD DNase family protein